MSVDEVRSGGEGARRSLDDAAACARQATTEAEALGAARQAATEADAEGLVRLVDDAETSLAAGRDALESAARATASEQSEAAAWGTGRAGSSTPGGQPP